MQQCQYRYHVIVSHPHEPRVLLVDAPGGLHLPSFTRDAFALWSDARPVNRAMKDLLGCRVATLRCLRVDVADDRSIVDFFHAGEMLSDGSPLPTSGRWIGPEGLDSAQLAMPEHRKVISEWFTWLTDEVSASTRPPWYRHGWMASAVAWVCEQVSECGAKVIGEVEQVRTTARGAILRAETTQGVVYLKAVPSMFAHEPDVVHALQGPFPANMPEVVAHDRERHWFLLRDLGSDSLEGESDLSAWAAALRAYSLIQVHTAQHVDDLLTIGCPDRRIGLIQEDVDELARDREALQLSGAPGGLTDEEIRAFEQQTLVLRSVLEELAGYRVPCALEHGDLWGAQIIRRKGAPVFIDWSDCSVSHPFFSPFLYILTEEVPAYMKGNQEALHGLQDAYLAPWTVYEPMSRLRELLALAGQVAPLHFALLYHRIILPNIETKWEWRLMLPYLLRRILEARNGF